MTTVALLPQYEWLLALELPRMVAAGLKEIGLREGAGDSDNPVILAWAKECGLSAIYRHDATAWCGLFRQLLSVRTGRPGVKDPLWALNWAKFGEPVAARAGLALSKPLVFQPGLEASLGDTLVFRRPGGGHVGLYIGEDATHYHVLGGNQGDRVSIVRVEKARCVAVRRPAYVNKPASAVPFLLRPEGEISRKES